MTKVLFIWALLIIILSACKGSEEGQLPKGVIEEKGYNIGDVQRRDTDSSSKIIIATPEIVSVKIFPSSPNVNDPIRAEVLTSEDASATYQWSINNNQVDISGNTLPPGEFKRGDKISLTITPFLENQKGNPVTVFSYIFNSPPKIVSDIKDSKYKDRSFVYQVKATDPDGDTLTYTLKQAPKGMVIDKTGLITWMVSEKDKSRHPVTVQVTDGHGGEALYNFDITIGSQ